MTPLVAAAPGGARVRVRLTPKARDERLDGVGRDADGAPVLIARVRAAPDKGAANSALEALLAKHLGLSRTSVRVARGTSSRLKLVDLAGAAPADVAAALARLPDLT